MWGTPWTVVAFVLLNLQIPVSVALGDAFNATIACALALLTALFFFLWRGSRVAWSILSLVSGFWVLAQPFDPAPWWAIGLSVIELGLLLAPATREFVWGTKRRVAAT
jgi:hypothetical protein